MDASINTDIEPLNGALFLAAQDVSSGEQLLGSLGASPQVIERLRGASLGSIETAKRCGVPLVIFSSFAEECLRRGPKEWLRDGARLVPSTPALQALNRIVVPIAYRVVRLYPCLGQTYFGLTRFGSSRLVELAYRDMRALAESHELLLELRDGDDLQFWNRLLMFGERLSGARAQWGVENWAFLSAGRAT